MTAQSLKGVANRLKASGQPKRRRASRHRKSFRPKPKPEGYVTGRPTLYRPEYCQAVIDCMAKGYDLTAFAGSIGVSRDAVYNWINAHREFNDAINIAKAKRSLALQTKLLTTKMGVGVTAAIFALKNAEPTEWQDRYYTETKVNVSVEQMSDAELYAIVAKARTPVLIEAKPVEAATDVETLPASVGEANRHS